MGELINGRTPEEIKAGLKACTTAKVPGYGCNIPCPYLNTPNCWLPVKSDALALIEHLESERDAALAKVPKWICVEERLPEENQTVLVYADGCVSIAEVYDKDMFTDEPVWSYTGIGSSPWYWVPLPEPPKEGE